MQPEYWMMASVALAALSLLCLFIALAKLGRSQRDNAELAALVRDLRQGSVDVERALREEAGQSRQEAGQEARSLREEVGTNLKDLNDRIVQTLQSLSQTQHERLTGVAGNVSTLTEANERRQEALRLAVEQRLADIKAESATTARQNREELNASLGKLTQDLRSSVEQMAAGQNARLEALRTGVESRLDTLRQENEAKLEQMRQTVDEKLQGTLDKRLGESFGIVAAQLEAVHRGVGEMQTLATGVGDLKRVLTNVKSRGTWGEVSLGALLDQVMAPEQFARNVEIVPGSGQRVEYAIRLPGKEEVGEVWLPIDAKFPHEDYERLVDAAERGDKPAEDLALKSIELRIRSAAKDICGKYVHPPHSTDFGILFLPTEGLYAEVLRRPGLANSLQLDCKVAIAGPTTLHALLSSLQVGFRSLAIQKRSSEVWQVLGAVKTEFHKYGEVLDGVQKRLQQADRDIEKVRVRERAIGRRLRGIESLAEAEVSDTLKLDDMIGAEVDALLTVTDATE